MRINAHPPIFTKPEMPQGRPMSYQSWRKDPLMQEALPIFCAIRYCHYRIECNSILKAQRTGTVHLTGVEWALQEIKTTHLQVLTGWVFLYYALKSIVCKTTSDFGNLVVRYLRGLLQPLKRKSCAPPVSSLSQNIPQH